MSDDLVAFLRARLDEDEADALKAVPEDTSPTWEHGQNPDGVSFVEDEYTNLVCIRDTPSRQFRHIARHDPARVLREIAATRATIDRWKDRNAYLASDHCDNWHMTGGEIDGLLIALQHKAAVYADHPDYDESWKP